MRHLCVDSTGDTVIGQCLRQQCVDSARDTCDWTVFETAVCVDRARDTCDWTVYERPMCGQCRRHV